MKIGLTGDTHNNLKNIEIICSIFNREKVELVIHTGDITLPKSLEKFSILNMPLFGVFGNNDQGDKQSLRKVCNLYSFKFDDGLKRMDLNNKEIIVVHDPKDIKDEHYHKGYIILHGHTHRFRDEFFKDTYIFNPGECAGFIKGSNKVGLIDINENPKNEYY